MSFTITIPNNILPKGYKFKENEQVDWSQKSLKEHSETEIVLDLASELGIEPKSIFKHLKVNLGELINEGQVLAEKSGFFGAKKIKATQQAEVRGINHENGTITLMVKKTVDVPFSLKAKFSKQDNEQKLHFLVSHGKEVGLQNSVESNFGGPCSYLQNSNDITLENCEHKIVVFQKLEMMDQAKLSALGPLAIIAYEANYRSTSIPLLLLSDRAAFTELVAKKFSDCLYLMGKKTCLFYQP